MTVMEHPHTPLSSPAEAGEPVRRGFSVQSLTSLEYWIVRLVRHPPSSFRARATRAPEWRR